MTAGREMQGDDGDHLKLLYEENARMFRFYLTWRQLLLAGYFTILAALALGYKWSLSEASAYSSMFPFVGSGISILFWALDYRNRQLYKHSSEAGAMLEQELVDKVVGYFGTYDDKATRLHHSTILAIFYLGVGTLLLLAGVLSVFLNLLGCFLPPT